MEQLKATINSVSTCNHGDEFSVSVEVEDAHVDMSSFNYDHKAGNTSRITIFGLQPEDMYELADKIIQAANKIRKVEVA